MTKENENNAVNEKETKVRKKKSPDPRINMAFYDDNLKFVQYASWKNRQSITQYVNSLITREMANYDRAEWDTDDK